jgi:hypothetical protein
MQRTLKEMVLRRGFDVDLPKGTPTGPWATPAQALAELNAFFSNPKTGDGGFAVSWGSTRKGVATTAWRRGDQKLLVCHERGLPHCCKWRLWVEECVEGWVIYKFAGHDELRAHSHELVQSREEANAHSSMRSIPEALLPIAKSMVASGVRPSDVNRWLQREVETEGKEVTFNYMDVYHATGASTTERAMDATNLAELMRQREQEQGLFYCTTTDGEPRPRL